MRHFPHRCYLQKKSDLQLAPHIAPPQPSDLLSPSLGLLLKDRSAETKVLPKSVIRGFQKAIPSLQVLHLLVWQMEGKVMMK